MDEDLSSLPREALVAEATRLREGIRRHRDASGHALCWHHPDLWALLPEAVEPRIAVPEWPQFLRGCIRYRQSLDEQASHAPRIREEYDAGASAPTAGVRAEASPAAAARTQLLVNIDVDDLQRAHSFYSEAFGLHAGRRFGADALELLGAGVAIYLLRKPGGTPASLASAQLRSYERHWTPVHLDLVVDDLDAALSRALAAGATLEQPVRTSSWGRLALLADPFGHGCCLVQFLGRGYDEIATGGNGHDG